MPLLKSNRSKRRKAVTFLSHFSCLGFIVSNAVGTCARSITDFPRQLKLYIVLSLKVLLLFKYCTLFMCYRLDMADDDDDSGNVKANGQWTGNFLSPQFLGVDLLASTQQRVQWKYTILFALLRKIEVIRINNRQTLNATCDIMPPSLLVVKTVQQHPRWRWLEIQRQRSV